MERFLLEHQDELGIEPVGTRERNGITAIVWKHEQRPAGWPRWTVQRASTHRRGPWLFVCWGYTLYYAAWDVGSTWSSNSPRPNSRKWGRRA